MKRNINIIINDELTDKITIELVKLSIDHGKMSDNGRSYCYAIISKPYYVTVRVTPKGNFSFWVGIQDPKKVV